MSWLSQFGSIKLMNIFTGITDEMEMSVFFFITDVLVYYIEWAFNKSYTVTWEIMGINK